MIYLAQKKDFWTCILNRKKVDFFSFKFGFKIGNDLRIERGNRIRICIVFICISLPPWLLTVGWRASDGRDGVSWNRVVGVLPTVINSEGRCLKVKGSAVWWCRWLKHGFVNNKLAINILFDDPLYFLKNDQPRSFVGCRCAFHSMENWQILSSHDY